MHIDDVPNGAKCNCICKSCNDELIARNGGKLKKHHFAHRNFIRESCLPNDTVAFSNAILFSWPRCINNTSNDFCV